MVSTCGKLSVWTDEFRLEQDQPLYDHYRHGRHLVPLLARSQKFEVTEPDIPPGARC